MQGRSVRDLESSGSFLTRAGPVGRALDKATSVVRRRPNYDASDSELFHLGNSSDADDTMFAASGRINSLARQTSDRSVMHHSLRYNAYSQAGSESACRTVCLSGKIGGSTVAS